MAGRDESRATPAGRRRFLTGAAGRVRGDAWVAESSLAGDPVLLVKRSRS